MKFSIVACVTLATLSLCVILTTFIFYPRVSVSIALETVNAATKRPQRSASPPAVAVCIAGHARTFRHAPVRQMLQQHILTPLTRAFANISVVHTFFVLRPDDAPTGNRSSASPDAPAVLTGIHQFHPTNIRWINTRNEFSNVTGWIPRDDDHPFDRFQMPQSCITSHRNSTSHFNAPKYVRFPHTLWRARQCLQVVRETERSNGITYDWLYRIRPDVVLLSDIVLPDQLNPQIVYTNAVRPSVTEELRAWWNFRPSTTKNSVISENKLLNYRAHVSDIITIASKRTMEVALSAFEAVKDCQVYRVPTRGGISENILLYWLLSHDVLVKTLPLEWVIVREKVGPECKRIKSLSSADLDVSHVLARCRQFARKIKPFFNGHHHTK